MEKGGEKTRTPSEGMISNALDNDFSLISLQLSRYQYRKTGYVFQDIQRG